MMGSIPKDWEIDIDRKSQVQKMKEDMGVGERRVVKRYVPKNFMKDRRKVELICEKIVEKCKNFETDAIYFWHYEDLTTGEEEYQFENDVEYQLFGKRKNVYTDYQIALKGLTQKMREIHYN